MSNNLIKPKFVCRSISSSSAVIKNQASLENKEGYYPAYSASGQDVWLPNYEFDTNAIVISAVGARCGKTFIAKGKFGVCANTHVLKVDTNKAKIEYLQYIFNNEDWWEKGGSAQPFVLVNDSLNKKIFFPSMELQTKIVDFLDNKVSRIDDAMVKTKQSIEEYKKLKQSVIFDTFNSMGNVKRYKLRHLGELKNGLNFHDVTSDITIKMLGVGDFKNYMILDSEVLFSELPIGDEPIPEDLLLQSGDIVFVRSNGSKELVGRSVLVDNVSYPLTFSGFCIRFRNTQQSLVLNQYLLYFFRSEKFKEILKLSSFGTNISNLSQDTLNAVRVPVPPIGDQLQIINMLKTKCAAFDGVIERKQQLLKELEQYKKSLIYEYVTGKKEVA